MNCFSCERNLSAYIDDELSAEVRLEVEAHLDACERCRAEYETHLTAWEAASDLRVEPAPDGLWKAVASELQPGSGAPTTEDLALLVRGLASEVRDLKRAVEILRQDLESGSAGESEDDRERVRRFNRLRVWSETPSRVESSR